MPASGLKRVMQRNRIWMKRILVIYYTQSGQLKEIADNFVAPFQKQGILVDFYEIQMETPYPFHGQMRVFLGLFQSLFLELPQPIKQCLLISRHKNMILWF